MAISSDDFKDVLRHFPAGVTLVTVKAGGEVYGLTVSAFASVSPTPPLIMVCIDHRGYSHELLQKSDAVFAVNFLHEEQIELSNRFAFVKDDRFAEGDWTTAATGAPVLADAVAWLDCTVYSRHSAGTHTIYIGEVQASQVVAPDGKPLIYWNREYRQLANS
ncbi:MAG: flavin reductase family protein [Anaerolineales bacterium]|nr:flavin reductase family protein [Anaerolineales bacterium]MCB0031284.1 flavin reductase family protein [Anaerolineales bacterium]